MCFNKDMTLKQYLIFMSFATGLCWIAWFFVILSTDPHQATFVIFLFFYLSLFLSIIGTFSVLGFLLKKLIIKKDEIIFRHVKRTFRQSILISVFLILILLLRQIDLLTWWNLMLLFFLFIIIESFIFTNRKYSNNDYVK